MSFMPDDVIAIGIKDLGSPTILILPADLFPPKDTSPDCDLSQLKPHIVTFAPTLLSCVPTAWVNISECTHNGTWVLGSSCCSQGLLKYKGVYLSFLFLFPRDLGMCIKIMNFSSYHLQDRKVQVGYLVNFLEESLYFSIWAYFWCAVLEYNLIKSQCLHTQVQNINFKFSSSWGMWWINLLFRLV